MGTRGTTTAALLAVLIGMTGGIGAVTPTGAALLPTEAPKPALDAMDPLLLPAAADSHPAYANVLALMPGMRFMCDVMLIDAGLAAVPVHCIDSVFGSEDIADPDYLVPLPAGDARLTDLYQVTEIMRVDAVRGNKDEDHYQGEFVFIRVQPKDGVTVATQTVRVPVVGEAVRAYGYAPREFFAAEDVATDAFTKTAAFATEVCHVVSVDLYIGTFATDCVTTQGTSGSPIVAESDGALLGAVGWGRSADDTNSGILAIALAALEHLPPVAYRADE